MAGNLSIYYILYTYFWPTLYYSGSHIKENEMGGTCGMYGWEEWWIEGFGGEIWGEETTWNT